MPSSKKILALIPARGGSKSIPKKNIIDLGGFPLIAYSIAAAKLAKNINRVIVSTDSEEIAEIAKKYGAEVPFLRPAEYATDTSPVVEFFQHALKWLAENESYKPDYIVQLLPTTPLRDPALVDEAIERILSNKEATSLRSAHEMSESAYKDFKMEGEFFVGLLPSGPDDHSLPRQLFPATYHPNGYVDILISRFVATPGQLYGNKILSFITPNTGELDSSDDLHFIEYTLQKQPWQIYEYLKKSF